MITLRDVEWRRGSFMMAIDELQLSPGLTLLIGKNGAGKTTLLHLLATALSPDRGDIRYGGVPASEALPIIRSQIGFVPTGLQLYEEMKPSQLLAYLGQLKGLRRYQEIDELMNRFHLSQHSSSKIKSLPQGIKQRLAIAQSFLGSPIFQFVDEPLNYLDNAERKSVIRQFAEQAHRKLIVISTHELNEWEYCANQILWIDQGRVRFYGTVEDWGHQLPARVWEGTVQLAQFESLPSTHVIHYRIGERLIDVRYFGDAPPGPEFAETDPTLEDIYFIRSRIQA